VFDLRGIFVCASVLFHACEADSLVSILCALRLTETVFVNSVGSESKSYETDN
jgi:hypothetical protein